MSSKVTSFIETLKFLLEGDARSLEFKPRKGAVNNLDLFAEKLNGLSDDQLIVIQTAMFGGFDVLSVTGKAGTGKTHTLKLMRELLEEIYDVKVVVVAPTGVAGQNAGGGTINSKGLGGGDLLPRGVREQGAGYNRAGIESCVSKGKAHLSGNDSLVVVLEEAFATPSEYVVLFYQLCDLIRPGEVKFVIVGDPGQLPPVNKVREGSLRCVSNIWEPARFVTKQGTEHVYGSILDGPFPIKEGKKPHWRSVRLALTKNHRQKDDKSFVSALNYIRVGGKLEGPASILLSRFMSSTLQPKNPEKALHIYSSRKKVAEVNELAVKKAKKAKTKTRIYNAVYSGDVSKVDIFPASLEMELAVGLPFMVRQNLPTKGVYNGTIGTIVELREHSIVISVKGRNVELEYEENPDVPVNGAGKPVCTLKMLPGHLGVGITGHKCQGLTLEEEVIVHLDPQTDGWLKHQAGAMYVMLSRVTSIDNLFIDGQPGFVNSLISASPEALNYIKTSEAEMVNKYGVEMEEQVTQAHVEAMTPVLVDKEQDEDDGSWAYQFCIYHAEGQTHLVGYGTDKAINSYLLIPDPNNMDDVHELDACECPYHIDCCNVLGFVPTVQAEIMGVPIEVEVEATCTHWAEPEIIELNKPEEVEMPNDSDLNKKEVSQSLIKTEEVQLQPQTLIKTTEPNAEVINKNGAFYLSINGLDIELSPYVLRGREDYRFSFGDMTLEVKVIKQDYILHKAVGLNKIVVEVLDPNEFAVTLATNPEKASKFEQFVKSERFGGLVLLEDRAAKVCLIKDGELNNLNKVSEAEEEEEEFYSTDSSILEMYSSMSSMSLEPEDVEEDKAMAPTLKHIGVVGTAGRKEDEPKLNKAVYDAMYFALLAQLKGVPVQERHLVSGGSAYADHLAVRAYLEGQCAKLTLHLPRALEKGHFAPYKDKAADTMDYYHRVFSQKCFIDPSVSRAQLAEALNKGATFTVEPLSCEGFQPLFERNKKVAANATDMLIAFTFGEVSKEGGTAHTWEQHASLNKTAERVHINVHGLIKTEARAVAKPVIRR